MGSEGYLKNVRGARIPNVLYSIFTFGNMTIFQGSGQVKYNLCCCTELTQQGCPWVLEAVLETHPNV